MCLIVGSSNRSKCKEDVDSVPGPGTSQTGRSQESDCLVFQDVVGVAGKRPRPICLVVLDGFGMAPPGPGNAISNAKTPNIDALWRDYPHTTLNASGEAVGLLPGQMGNSNVGHLNLGAGRVVYQDLVRITKSIQDESFFENPALCRAVERVGQNRHLTLHLMGLLSDGGVHSDETHVFALLDLAKMKGVKNVVLHCFLDGRDVPPTSALIYLRRLEEAIKSKGVGRIGTIAGRFYAMDRDKRWERTCLSYHSITLGEGRKASSPLEAIRNAYEQGETDEFVYPTVICQDSDGNAGEAALFAGQDVPGNMIRNGDSLIFWNFRADRARQITRAFVDPSFSAFDRRTGFLDLHFCGMTRYDEELDIPCGFGPVSLKNTLGEVVSRHGLRQLRIAETEKYAHVTFFFNGGEETPFPGEDRKLIPSPKVSTYDEKPEMSAYEVTSAAISEIESGKYDLMIINYANLDMVGHTGDFDAAVAAVEAVDDCLGRLIDVVREVGGTALIVSDHGNAERMLNDERIDGNEGTLSPARDGTYFEPHTAHTSNPVPCILVCDFAKDVTLRPRGALSDVAPTLLHVLGIEKPIEMDGVSLIEYKSGNAGGGR